MTCIEKILLAFVIVHVALVLAKPHKFKFDEPEEDASGSGSRDSNEMMDYFRKRASKTRLHFTIPIFVFNQ